MLAVVPPRDQLVTSSDFVRRFGVWQDRATREPVYILHRGRPRLVLTSVEVMDALCAPHGKDAEVGDGDIHALLAATSDMVLIADPAGRVLTASLAARRHFGTLADIGAPLAALASSETNVLLGGAIARVLATGMADELDLPSSTHPSRRLALRIEPHRGGLLVIARDTTIDSEWRDAREAIAAVDQAIAAIDGIATAAISLRGYLEAPDASLARLTGLDPASLANVRFVSLVEIGGRAGVADTIEAVSVDGAPRAVSAVLLVNRAAPLLVRIGIAPRRAGMAVAGLTAIIAATPAG
ncbi:MAG: hypothetical protein M3R41_08130 [Pseudomonadota bacterium]|nr:hypothetical protein [Pseudomonadota bacterium]